MLAVKNIIFKFFSLIGWGEVLKGWNIENANESYA